MDIKRNYYKVLGIDNNANNNSIKKAFKQLARKWHPDKNLNNINEATSVFKEIKEAYDVLSNKKLRHIYDKTLNKELNSNSLNFEQKVDTISLINIIKRFRYFYDSIFDNDFIFQQDKLKNFEYIETEIDFNGDKLSTIVYIKNGVKTEETFINNKLIETKISSSLSNLF